MELPVTVAWAGLTLNARQPTVGAPGHVTQHCRLWAWSWDTVRILVNSFAAPFFLQFNPTAPRPFPPFDTNIVHY